MLRRKSISVISREAENAEVHRHYSFCSLLALGVGGTIGSGVFVLTGQVARNLAGPGVCLSWLMAGVACIVTALSYAELTTLITTPGSTYAFAYVGLGEVFAVVAAWLLSLEYAISAAAVARSWGDKVAFWFQESGIADCSGSGSSWCSINRLGDSSINLPAGLLVLAVTALQLRGLSLGRRTTNVLVFLKVCLVLFVIFVGLLFVNPENLTPFIPPHHTDGGNNETSEFMGGIEGVLTGASITFFGFLGFDEVAALSAEAINPRKDVPAAILATVSTITVLYFCSALVLVSMLPYSSISADEAFGSAFLYVKQTWAMHLLVFGEVFLVLPVVVLVSLIPQPRLLFALAKDGLAPKAFARVDRSFNYRNGTIFTGSVAGAVALFVPFESLNDVISGGILLSFVLANCSNVLIRVEATRNENPDQSCTVPLLSLIGFVGLSAAGCVILESRGFGFELVACMCIAWGAHIYCFRSLLRRRRDITKGDFEVPWLPVVAGVAIQLDLYLFTRLSRQGILQTFGIVLMALVYYLGCLLVQSSRNAELDGDFERGFTSVDETVEGDSSGIELHLHGTKERESGYEEVLTHS